MAVHGFPTDESMAMSLEGLDRENHDQGVGPVRDPKRGQNKHGNHVSKRRGHKIKNDKKKCRRRNRQGRRK